MTTTINPTKIQRPMVSDLTCEFHIVFPVENIVDCLEEYLERIRARDEWIHSELREEIASEYQDALESCGWTWHSLAGAHDLFLTALMIEGDDNMTVHNTKASLSEVEEAIYETTKRLWNTRLKRIKEVQEKINH